MKLLSYMQQCSIFKKLLGEHFANSDIDFLQNKISNNGNPVYSYSFMMNIDKKEYPEYLKKVYLIKTGKKLNLKNPKDINEKIQWLKLYDSIPLKTQLTDKVLVRDWVKEKIGEKYLKPVLQICNSFDEINFESMPESFIVKCNHGCKWAFLVKNKEKFLEQTNLFKLSKRQMEYWLSHNYFGLSDFELQYKDIAPKIIIEPLLRETINEEPVQIQVYCFNSEPKIAYKYARNQGKNKKVYYTTYDENFNILDLQFILDSEQINSEADDLLKEAVCQSKILAEKFKFVRVDWMLYKNQLYFEEMTFTPHSGFYLFNPKYNDWYKKLGNMINLKGE